jgi:hypothetical protein
MAYYTGNNEGPLPPGVVPPPFEEYTAGIQGEVITVIAKGDKCGRRFYIQGTFHFDGISDPDAEISGTMLRCTNSVLLGPPCNERKDYQVQFKGTIKRLRGDRAGLRRLSIDITYFPDEKWIRENCKKARIDRGSDSLVLTEAKPFERSPTGKIISDDIDEAEKLIIDGLLMKGAR